MSGGGGQQYAAFISYSHSDERIARWLHRRLESYRTPKTLAGQEGRRGAVRGRIGRVFRDREEFAAGGELKAEIEAALSRSDALIVLCSPRSAVSPYVNLEISYFKTAHPGALIVPVILEGEPEDCFPPALKDGSERLGADFRVGGDGREAGALKVLAGLLGVGVDALIQRERLAQRARLTFASALAGLLLCLAVAAAWFGYDASVKGREAATQRQEAIAQRDAALAALGRVFAVKAWAAADAGNYILASKYLLSGQKISPRYEADFRAVAARVRHDLAGSELWSSPEKPLWWNNVVFSDDGNYVALRYGNECPIVDLRDRSVVSRVGVCSFDNFNVDLRSLVVAGSEIRLLTTKRFPKERRVHVELWDGRTGKRVGFVRLQSGLSTESKAGLFSDGRHAYVETWLDRAGIALIDMATGETSKIDAPNILAVNGDRLLLNSSDRTINVWDASKRDITLRTGRKYTDVCATDDGLVIGVMGARADSGDVEVWNLSEQRITDRWRVTDGVHDPRFDPFCNALVTSNYDGRGPVIAWDAVTGKELLRVPANGSRVQRLSVSPNGKWALLTAESNDWGGLSLDATAGDLPQVYALPGGERFAELRGQPAGDLKIIWNNGGDDSGGLLTIDNGGVALFRRSIEPTLALSGDISAVTDAVGSDGKNFIFAGLSEGKIRSIALPPFNPAGFQLPPEIMADSGTAIAILPHGKRIISGDEAGVLRVWEIATGKLAKTINAQSGYVEIIRPSFDRARVVTAASDGPVEVWDIDTGQRLATLPVESDGVAVRVLSGRGRLWRGDNDNNLAFDNGGELVATALDSRNIRIWDVKTSKRKQYLTTTERVNAIAFSGEGKLLVAGGMDGVTRVFDVASGKQVGNLASPGSPVSSVNSSANGNIVAVGSEDGSLVIWDRATSRQVVRLEGHLQEVTHLEFTTDGALLVSWDIAGLTKAWMLPGIAAPYDELAKSLCGTFLKDHGRQFTADEIEGDDLVQQLWAGETRERDVCEGVD